MLMMVENFMAVITEAMAVGEVDLGVDHTQDMVMYTTPLKVGDFLKSTKVVCGQWCHIYIYMWHHH